MAVELRVRREKDKVDALATFKLLKAARLVLPLKVLGVTPELEKFRLSTSFSKSKKNPLYDIPLARWLVLIISEIKSLSIIKNISSKAARLLNEFWGVYLLCINTHHK